MEEFMELKVKKKSFRSKYKNEIIAYSMLAYPLLHWGLFFVYSFFRALYLSFTKWDLGLKPPVWVGLKNYISLFHNKVFLQALGNTILWTIAMAIGPVVIGLCCALVVNSLRNGKTAFTAMLYWPALVSAVVSTTIQAQIFSSSPSGLANKILSLFGKAPVQWLDNPHIALLSLMIMPFFFGFSTNMLFFLAGLKQIPPVFHEAAKVDGANKAQMFFSVTLPLLKPVIFLNLILGVIGGFRVLAPMQLITSGGPSNKTMSIVLFIYNQGFKNYKMGYANAALSFC
jgi:multiple sugar transport system permease protein